MKRFFIFHNFKESRTNLQESTYFYFYLNPVINKEDKQCKLIHNKYHKFKKRKITKSIHNLISQSLTLIGKTRNEH